MSSNYKGQYISGLFYNIPHGIGTMINNNSIYEGDWINGKKLGNGKLIFKNNNILFEYEGEWNNDKKNGYGVEKIINNCYIEKYSGNWKNDVKDGTGILEIKYNLRNKLEYKIIYEGKWINGEKQGLFKVFENNEEFVKTYLNDRLI